MVRTIFSIWESTRCTLSSSFPTTVRFPTRSSVDKPREMSNWSYTLLQSRALPTLLQACQPHMSGYDASGPAYYQTLTVEPKVLGKRLCTEELKALGDKVSHSPGILVQAARGKTLIRRVEERKQAPSLEGGTVLEGNPFSTTCTLPPTTVPTGGQRTTELLDEYRKHGPRTSDQSFLFTRGKGRLRWSRKG